ncbi:hypothetical protein ACF0H5_013770 [Mactra antiquata]
MLKVFDGFGHSNWVTNVRTCLCSNGFAYVWEAQEIICPNQFLSIFVQRLKDQYIQSWHESCERNSKLLYYRQFKNTYTPSNYVLMIDIDKFRKCLANFRSSSHELMVEKGRHFNIDRDFRYCPYCETVLEDEYHFICHCPLYHDLRKKYLPVLINSYISIQQFIDISGDENHHNILNLSMFIYHVLELRSKYVND